MFFEVSLSTAWDNLLGHSSAEKMYYTLLIKVTNGVLKFSLKCQNAKNPTIAHSVNKTKTKQPSLTCGKLNEPVYIQKDITHKSLSGVWNVFILHR